MPIAMALSLMLCGVCVQLLVKRGTPVDLKSASGTTCLIEALRRGHKKTAKLLVKLGARLDAVDNQGVTEAQVRIAGARSYPA